MIKFNQPLLTGLEKTYLLKSLEERNYCGRGPFTKKVEDFLKADLNINECLLTPSCTQALEMAAILLNIEAGDEVIMPSFTFVSTALAFVMRGARIKFVDIRRDTLNIDENLIEMAVTDKTKAIVPVHYAGIACEMNAINTIAKKYNLAVVEDAAQGINCTYQGKRLGSLGDLGAFSFHETKNIQCGEGGALVICNPKYTERAEILREKGTNRKQFIDGQIDKYTWIDLGSSYLLNDYSAAFLLAQLESKDTFMTERKKLWNQYYKGFEILKNLGVTLPHVPMGIEHNGHIFYLITRSPDERTKLINYLKEKKIQTASHYVPLHSSLKGREVGTFIGEDQNTTDLSLRLLRMPMHNNLSENDVEQVITSVMEFYEC